VIAPRRGGRLLGARAREQPEQHAAQEDGLWKIEQRHGAFAAKLSVTRSTLAEVVLLKTEPVTFSGIAGSLVAQPSSDSGATNIVEYLITNPPRGLAGPAARRYGGRGEADG
jgi:DICT domain-containing protein